MQMTIDVPDTLPQERLKQRIKELEQSLLMEAQFFAVFSKQQTALKTVKRNTVILGTLAGAFKVPENFDDPLPDEICNEFYKTDL